MPISKKHISFSIVIFLFSGMQICFSQKKQIDSLIQIIKNEKVDTSKVRHMSNLAWLYSTSNLDSALAISYRGLKLVEKAKVNFRISRVSNDIGWFSHLKGDELSAIEFTQRALNYLDSVEKENSFFDTLIYKGRSASYGNLAIIFREQGNYPKAQEYHLKALKIAEQLKDEHAMARTYGNLGLIYADQKEYKKALDYYFKALKLDEKAKNLDGLSFRYNNIGIAYFELKEYPKALQYYFKGLKVSNIIGDKRKIARCLGNIGNVYVQEEQNKIAFNYYHSALKINEEIKSKNGITIQLGNIGALLIKEKNFTEAEIYLLKSLEIDQEIGYLRHVEDTYKNLDELYENKKDFKKAYTYYTKYIETRDSLFNKDKNSEIIRQDMNYEFEKKETAAKAEQTKKDALMEEEKQKQTITIYSTIGGLCLVLLLAIAILRSLWNNKKANRIITHQKNLVEEKQKEILDSIRYAKRIQSALLPTEKYIDKNLNRLKK